MSVLLYADERAWLALPKSFPTASGQTAAEWENAVLDGMRPLWGDKLTAEAEEAVRQALRHGLTRVLPEDSVTLQYWPTAALANVVVHVVASVFGDGDRPQVVPLDAGPFPREPVVEAFESEFLGTGVEARYLTTVETTPPMEFGAVNYLFENETGFVFVGTEPTLPRLVGIMFEPLREVVRSIRVLDDDGIGSWQPAAADAAALGSRGETWNDVPAPGEAR